MYYHEQVIKVIRHKVASLTDTDGSIVFTRLCQCASHQTHASLGPPSPRPKRHLDRFSHFCTAHGRESLYFTVGHPFPLKIAPWGILIPSDTWFLWPTRVRIQNSVSIGSVVFTGFTVVTDQQTDRPHYSICSNRLRLASAAMWPNNGIRVRRIHGHGE